MFDQGMGQTSHMQLAGTHDASPRVVEAGGRCEPHKLKMQHLTRHMDHASPEKRPAVHQGTDPCFTLTCVLHFAHQLGSCCIRAACLS